MAERIVSLLPSATEIVCALGLRDRLVGVTHECDFPESVRELPRVTGSRIPAGVASGEIDRLVSSQVGGGESLYSLDAAALNTLAPDLIISQTLCDVCAVAESEVTAALRGLPSRPRVLYLEPTRLEDVFESIQQVARAAGVESAARPLVLSLRQRLARLRPEAPEHGGPVGGATRSGIDVRVGRGDVAASRGGPPRVVVLEWLDPLFTCGHWTPDLVAACGAIEPLAGSGERSRRIEESDLIAADPDALLIACCGFDVARTMADVPAFLARSGVSGLRCVRQRRVFVVDGSQYFSRPGPRLVDSAELLCHAVFPGRIDRPASAGTAVVAACGRT